MPFSTSDGVRLWTATSGSATSAPPVVVLHGGPGLWDDYAVFAELLDDLTVVHRFDQRGCGRSDPSDVQTMARLAQDIDELRAYFGHERIVVLGHSFGASLAMTYAAAYGEHVAGVVYVGGVGIGDWHPHDAAERARRMTPEQEDRLDNLSGRPRTPAEEIEFRVLSWFPDHADRERAMEWAYESASVDLPINFAANRALAAEMNGWTVAEVTSRAASTGPRDVRPRRRRPPPRVRRPRPRRAHPEPHLPPDPGRRPLTVARAAGALPGGAAQHPAVDRSQF
ncbi:alpha/beta fold hydrolase [Kribbella speibonae]|uniref:prolyl aminopeptidase n=1 Tax=Kribbella speibonae TaxID=1572660 RepID=A0ABY2ABR7_9ACTN|nr:alpha/beta fold hydrolase [Kribbella speibonae]TCC27143.1 alpha/beta fold hydrolase [Kribbella speibonae]